MEDDYNEDDDLFGCYYVAVAEMRRRWEAGEQLPPQWNPEHQEQQHG